MKVEYIRNVKINIATIYPDDAEKLLENNPINRKPSKKVIKQYADDMKNGDFLFSNHTVCLSDEGKLLDGQQRLMACVEADSPFSTILVEGLPEHVIKVIDSGKKRSYADQLGMDGYANAALLAASVKMLGLIALQNPKDSGWTFTQLNRIFEKHEGLVDSVQYCKNAFNKSGALLAAIHYIAKNTGYEDRADLFIESWKGKVFNYEHDPVHYVRQKLIKADATDKKVNKMPTVTRMRYIMLSWLKFKDHIEMQQANIGPFYMDHWNKKTCGIE